MSDKFRYELIKKLGPQRAFGLVKSMTDDEDLLSHAVKVQLPAHISTKDILGMYPVTVARQIANCWGLDQSGKKDQIIENIIVSMVDAIPNIIDKMSAKELKVLEYIAEHRSLNIRKARRMFNTLLVKPGPFFDSFDAFMAVYVRMGILIVGTRRLKDTDHYIVTMTSDVKRIMTKHAGWNVVSDVAQDGHKETSTGRTAQRTRKQERKPIIMPLPPELALNQGHSIFKKDRIEIKPGDIFINTFEAMAAYAITKYKNEFIAQRLHCPYKVTNMSIGFAYKQQMTWFLAKWINPATRTTIAEEFIKECVDDKETADEIMQFTHLFSDIFMVIGHDGDDIVAYGTRTDRTYKIVTACG
ncbi:MAG: hypothetical protein F4Y51_03325, partial [Cenarchaeum sp. SB0664_bin_35]|nr:hypothetical protein [Cenarchaeum sp. SB0664_bin_35]